MIKTILERQRLRNTYHVEPIHVQNNLSVTPSQMNQMRMHGIPISSNLDTSKFYDGDSSPVVSIDPMLMRGVDILDAWNAEQSSKNRLANANTRDIQVYGK